MKRLLLDTHTLLWVIGKSYELSPRMKDYITDCDNEVYVSAISLWEIALKCSIGKLELNFEVEDIPVYCTKFGFRLIPLDPLDALHSLKLPLKENHKDPFDRMLIYQCIRHNYTLLSRDNKMKLYENEGLQYIW